MKEIAIITDGSPCGTTLYFDGEPVTNVNSIEFKCSAGDDLVDLKVGYVPYVECPLATAEELVTGINAALGKDNKNETTTQNIQRTD